MGDKTKVTLTLDTDLVDLGKVKYKNFSGRVNELISIDLNGTDEEAILLEEISNLNNQLKIKKDKLCKVRKKEALLKGSDDGINSVLDWARKVYGRNGVIGLNMLEKECKSKKVSFENVKNILEQEDVAFVNYA